MGFCVLYLLIVLAISPLQQLAISNTSLKGGPNYFVRPVVVKAISCSLDKNQAKFFPSKIAH